METKALVFGSWDDLVFANRHKSYGAYLLRKAYTRRVILGTGISIALITVLLAIPQIASNFKGRVKVEPVLEGFTVIEFADIPRIKPKDPPKPRFVARQQAASTTQVEVVRYDVTEQIIETSSTTFTNSHGVPGGEGDDVVTVSGTGTVSIPIDTRPLEDRTVAEVMPSYEGGAEAMYKFIRKKLKYPAAPRRLGIDGIVYVSFVVNGDGTVSKVSIVRGIHPDCDEEAMRVISMLPGWIGGKQGGAPVPVKMVLPIKFQLQ